MRSLLIVALLSTPALAERPRPTFIDVGMKQRPPVSAPVSSRIIFLHRCPPAGCTVTKGVDDSRQNISKIVAGESFPNGTVRTIGEFTQSADTWSKMLSCVRATFAPFDIMVTDVDPGPQIPHYEHIVGGKPSQLRDDIGGAGGVAPATCTEIPNAISYTFDVYGSDHETLCWTASQEVAHAFGLEHELNSKDPLTYLEGNLPKRFQAADAQCGEGIPRTCMCTGGLQNSYEHIISMFGPGTPTPPMLTVKAPTSGRKVQPGFITRVQASDDSGLDHVEILVDGVKIAESFKEPYTIVAPVDAVEQGPHVLEVRAVDIQGTPASQMIDIIMGPPCTASDGCEGVDVCVAGVCTPGPDAAGGLGYECSAPTECLSGNCVKDGGSFGYCVEQCNPAIEGVCPENFECLDAGGGAGVCWPNESGGCCDTGGSGKGPMMLAFGVLVLVLRKRRGR